MTRPRVRDDLAALTGYHSPQVDVDVRLNTNEAPAAPPAAYSAAVARAAESIAWHRYPDRAATELRSRLAAIHAAEGAPVTIDNVFCANGSNEVLQTILLAFAGPGRQILTFEPTYALHQHIGHITGAERLAVDRTSDFLIDTGELAELFEFESPAVTFVCSPNNPTGMVEPRETIEALLEQVTASGGLLVVDEAYGQFSDFSAQELLGEDVPLVVSRTYSKTWAMAGARLGYLLGPAWLVSELEKVVLPYHLDALKQAAGIAALDFLDDMSERVAEIVAERSRVDAALRALGNTVWTSGANFILFRPPLDANGKTTGSAVWQGLVDRSVLVRNTSSWEYLDGCLRVTIGTPADNDRFLAALTDVLTASDSGDPT